MDGAAVAADRATVKLRRRFPLRLLWLNLRHRFKKGDFLLLYIVSYSFIRFTLEFLRIDVTLVSNINVSQTVTGLAGLAALAFLIWRHRPGAPQTGCYPDQSGGYLDESAASAEHEDAHAA